MSCRVCQHPVLCCVRGSLCAPVALDLRAWACRQHHACAWRVMVLKRVALGAARASELCIRDKSVLAADPRAVLLPCAVCSVRLQIMCLVFAHVVCSAVSTLPRSVSSATDRIVLVHVHASQSLSMRRTRPVLHRCNSRRIPTPFRSCVMMSQRTSMGTAIRRP